MEKRLNNLGEQSEKESIWSIYSKWRGKFYITFSIFGISISAATLCGKWSENFWSWNTLFDLFKVETFNEIGIGIFSSVAVVWFGFQTWEAIVSAYQSFLDQREARFQKERDEGRREERRWRTSLRNQGVSDDVIRNAINGTHPSGKDRQDYPIRSCG